MTDASRCLYKPRMHNVFYCLNILVGHIWWGHERQADSELPFANRVNTEVSIIIQGCIKGELANQTIISSLHVVL